MDVKPGDVVILKSGGQPMTVAEVKGPAAVCLWIGEEGDLFRETLPLIVLDLFEEWQREIDADGDDEENGDDDDDEDEDDDDDDDGDDEDAEVKDKSKKRR
jgi:uncharacterized protein YodC (DUF2158 family)